MLELGFNELVSKIVKESKLSEAEIINRVDKKVLELSGLVSRNGAAHIIANELGIKLLSSADGRVLSINEVTPGLSNVTVIGRITEILPKREFEHEGRKGSVITALMSDGVKQARLVFWNDKVQILESGRINVDDTLKVHHTRSKDGFYGLELHLTNRSRIELNPEGVSIPKTDTQSIKTKNPARRLTISEFHEGLEVSVRACIVQLFERNSFYEVCPDCNKKVTESMCAQHGQVTPKHAMVVNAVLDDGTGNIRGVFFRENAESLLGIKSDEAFKLSKESNDDSAVIKQKSGKVLGNEMIFSGRIVKNNFTNNLELTVNSISKPNILSEIKDLIKSS